jgi:hypothetical protein
MTSGHHYDVLPENHSTGCGAVATGKTFQDAGREAASRMLPARSHRSHLRALEKRAKEARTAIDSALARAERENEGWQWLAGNFRLIRTAQKETRGVAKSLKDHPAVALGERHVPRPYAVAESFLDAAEGRFSEAPLEAFLAGFQEVCELEMGELWALKPVLQLLLLERIAAAAIQRDATVPVLVSSLRTLGEAAWKEVFEKVNVVDAMLATDPARAYSAMDYESRDLYRKSVAQLAKHSSKSESEVAALAVDLARQIREAGACGRAAVRRSHAGFFLVDKGLAVLKETLGYRRPLPERVSNLVLQSPNAFFLFGIELLTFVVAAIVLSFLDTRTPLTAAALMLLLPASQAAVDFMNNLTSFLLRPRRLPKLDFSEGVPEHCITMVAVPTLLLNERQVRQLVMDLEIRFLANRDRNIYFALVSDSPDSDRPVDSRDELVHLCQDLVTDLNRRYGSRRRTPFYLFHRRRLFNASEGRWMGWERKRGKLLDLNQFMRGGPDTFPVKVGDLSVLPHVRYVITLDSDTQLPRDSASRLIGAIAHPLNQAVIDFSTNMVVEGYGILQPRIGISVHSASRSRLAGIYSGQTGFDIYTRAVSDVYQDLFGEGIFTGKGIYEVDVFNQVLADRFPDNALLSHDLIEGAYARVALASDIELIDDYPSHFSAYSRRQHRWLRGDWQILRWLLPQVPDRHGRTIVNPVSLISRWKMLDNLRRSLLDPATLALLVAGWFGLPGGPVLWTMAAVAMLLIPAYSQLFFAVLRAAAGRPRLWPWLKDTVREFVHGHVVALLHIAFLLHQTFLALDAIVRSLARVFVTGKRLLEWETAAEAEAESRRKARVDVYLEWAPYVTAAVAALLYVLRPSALPAASPVLALWFISRPLSYWLNRSPRLSNSGLQAEDVALLRSSALRSWRYFSDWSSGETNWLIPDHVREDGETAPALSPTNLGFLLNARIAAVHFGYLTLEEFVRYTLNTLERMGHLRRYRGHFLNWYDARTLQVLEPRFVSTVDSGNLAACLWTLKQAALAFSQTPQNEEILWQGICDLADEIASCGGESARALRERVLHRARNWKSELGELEGVVAHFAEQSTGEASWWAGELCGRIAAVRAALEHPAAQDVIDGLLEIAETAGRLVRDMDFSFLYHRRKKVLSVGYNLNERSLSPSGYDLLASESRIASFIAIAKGDVPQEAWFHLGRRHTLACGERVLVSWTGTMFEYLMPAIWMRHRKSTIMHDSMKAAVRVQRRVSQRTGLPWGVSESGCCGLGTDYGYVAFGLPELAMRCAEPERMVISPYSAFLALPIEPENALANVHRMAEFGWTGRYGFYEAADYSNGEERLVRSWMAHHQGMILLSICNLLCEHPLVSHFHAEPHVEATELLLHERVPAAIQAEAEEVLAYLPHPAAA